MRNRSFDAWLNNRPRSKVAKFASWRSRPLGMIMRALEVAFLGAPLQQIVRSNSDIDEIKHLLPNSFLSGPAKDILVSGALVSLKNGLVLLESGHVIAKHLNSHSYLSGNLTDEIKLLKRGRFLMLEPEVILVLPKQDYFYHFLIDFLPHLIRLHEDHKELVVVVNKNEEEYVTEYLKIHKIPYINCPAKAVSAKSILIPNYASLTTSSVQSLLRSSLNQEMNQQCSKRKIALLRFRGPRLDREFENGLREYLVRNEYEIFDPEDLNIPEQIQLFSDASEIIAIHGGVLANLIYCKDGTKVHEIFTHPYRTLFFMAISIEIGLNYTSSESIDFEINQRS